MSGLNVKAVVYGGFMGLYRVILENQMEKNMENEMETGGIDIGVMLGLF